MPRRIDPRAAGPAAQTGAGDVALFGAVPLAFADSPAAAATHVEIGPPAAAGQPEGQGQAPAAAGEHDALIEPLSASDGLAMQPGAPPLRAPVAPPAAQSSSAAESGASSVSAAQAPAGSHIATFVSSVVPHAMNRVAGDAAPSPHDDIAPAIVAATQPPIDDTLATIRATAASLHDAIGALADRLEANAADTTQPIDAQLGEVQQQVDTVIGQIDGVEAAVTHDIASSIGALAGSAQHSVATALTHAADLADIATTAVDQTIDDTAAIVGAITDDVTTTADDLIGQADTVLSAAGDSIDDSVDLGGLDPAGGVATLVGMVHAADAYDLSDTPIAHDLVPALGALGATDLLAEVAPADALLGVNDHHDGLLAGATDHLTDGLFGHG